MLTEEVSKWTCGDVCVCSFGATVVEKWEKFYVLLFCKVSEVWHGIPIGFRHAKNMFVCTVAWRVWIWVCVCACACGKWHCPSENNFNHAMMRHLSTSTNKTIKITHTRNHYIYLYVVAAVRRTLGRIGVLYFLLFFSCASVIFMFTWHERVWTEPRLYILSIYRDDVCRDFELQRAIPHFLRPFTKLTISSA